MRKVIANNLYQESKIYQEFLGLILRRRKLKKNHLLVLYRLKKNNHAIFLEELLYRDPFKI
jgi:hypothetical protein